MQIYMSHPHGHETYVYRFAPDERRDVLAVIGRQCLNPDLSLDWRDALKLEKRIRLLCKMASSFGRRETTDACGTTPRDRDGLTE